ncbi:hypothetical protein B0H13DRAFT_2278398 [Mycena leptocephala]|nr:hypothetical protein B0H13DRAFT_2278398 [Mycena leptocephala]
MSLYLQVIHTLQLTLGGLCLSSTARTNGMMGKELGGANGRCGHLDGRAWRGGARSCSLVPGSKAEHSCFTPGHLALFRNLLALTWCVVPLMFLPKSVVLLAHATISSLSTVMSLPPNYHWLLRDFLNLLLGLGVHNHPGLVVGSHALEVLQTRFCGQASSQPCSQAQTRNPTTGARVGIGEDDADEAKGVRVPTPSDVGEADMVAKL